MRYILLFVALALSACRSPYMSEIADMTVYPFEIPEYGTEEEALNTWFDANRFSPGPKVWQAETELRRLPGAALVYASEADRSWWMSRSQTVRDFCVTEKYVYYKLDGEKRLSRAILTSRSWC